ncbi:hypothetical protein CDV36_011773 [Fusarium kuroshium]|uniref:Uncharacterized protein n=1 Tax=Fusarium kuroshium TaxID=2010991 RepID=A0A3M2RUN7_9HYPO|nr:hypothetical protein CDV36_011773 [Fusarium kuroshium]
MHGQLNTKADKADAHGAEDGCPAGECECYLGIYLLFPSAHDARGRLKLGAIQWKSYPDLMLAVVEDGLRLVSPIDTSIPREPVSQQGPSLASEVFECDMCKRETQKKFDKYQQRDKYSEQLKDE